MRADRTPHQILGVSEGATQDEIRSAYRRLARQTHPDAGGSAAMFDVVREAYEQLQRSPGRGTYRSAGEEGSATAQAASSPRHESATGARTPPTTDATEPPTDLGGNESQAASSSAPSASATGASAPRARSWMHAAFVAAIALVLWRLVFHQSEGEALGASAEGATGDEPVVLPTVVTSPTVTAVPTTSTPTEARLNCTDLGSVRVSYEMVSETAYGIHEYRPQVTAVNGSGYPVRVSVGGWGEASNASFPDFPEQAMWAQHYLDVPAGGMSTEVLGQRTGDYLGLGPGEEILEMRLSASVSLTDASLANCEAPVVPAS